MKVVSNYSLLEIPFSFRLFSENPLETATVLETATQRTVCYKKISTTRVQCIFKVSVFLDNVLGIVFIKEL